MPDALRVLVVEDNPGDADLTKETLEESKLHVEISIVPDGAEALAYLRGEPPYEHEIIPDLVLLDLNLPKLDGRQVLRVMRKHDRLKKLPVVVMTSSDAERDVVTSYELGANCYVTKPVGFEAFRSIVRSVESFWFTVVRLP